MRKVNNFIIINLTHNPNFTLMACLIVAFHNKLKDPSSNIAIFSPDFCSFNQSTHKGVMLCPLSEISDFIHRYSSSDVKTQVVFWGNKAGLAKLENEVLLLKSIKENRNLKASIFPDGFINTIWWKDLLFDYSSLLGVPLSDENTIYQFHNVCPITRYKYPQTSFSVINDEECFLSALSAYNSVLFPYTSNVNLQKLHDRFDSVVYLLLRPWCTDHFHDGRYKFGDGINTLKQIYSDLINEAIDGCSNFAFIVKGDPRSKGISVEINNFFEKRFPGRVFNYEDIFSTNNVTLEPVLYLLEKRGLKQTVISLDSSAAVASCYLNLTVDHLIGYSNRLLYQRFAPENVVEYINSHVERTKSLVELRAERGSKYTIVAGQNCQWRLISQ